MPPGCFPLEVFWAHSSGRPRLHWKDDMSHLAWERLGILQVAVVDQVAHEKQGAKNQQLPLLLLM